MKIYPLIHLDFRSSILKSYLFLKYRFTYLYDYKYNALKWTMWYMIHYQNCFTGLNDFYLQLLGVPHSATTGWLRQTKICSLTVLETRSLKSRCWGSCGPSKAFMSILLCLFQVLVAPVFLWLVVFFCTSSRGSFCSMSISQFSSSY